MDALNAIVGRIAEIAAERLETKEALSDKEKQFMSFSMSCSDSVKPIFSLLVGEAPETLKLTEKDKQ